MAITGPDIKLYKSQYMNDTDLGGGHITGTEVADGTINDLFPHISRLDKLTGTLNLRRTNVRVIDAGDGIYGGAHVVLTSRSTDVYVSEFLLDDDSLLRSDVGGITTRAGGGNVITTITGTINTFTATVADASDLIVGGIYDIGDDVVNPDYHEHIAIVGIAGTDLTLVTALKNTHAARNLNYPALGDSVRAYAGVVLNAAALAAQKDIELQTLYTLSEYYYHSDAIDHIHSRAIVLFKAGDIILIKEGATEEYGVIASITNDVLTLKDDLVNTYTTAAIVGSVKELGDLQVTPGVSFTQTTWDTETFADAVDGAAASLTYNFVTHPLVLTNGGTISDKIGLHFITATEFYIISEKYGNLGKGDTSIDVTPINPVTDTAYHTLDKDGWGGVGTAGNVLRYNYDGTEQPVWVARYVEVGCTGTADDGFDIEIRGDVEGVATDVSTEIKWGS